MKREQKLLRTNVANQKAYNKIYHVKSLCKS